MRVPQLCKVCHHPQRAAIEAALERGESDTKIAARYDGLSRTNVGYHKRSHLASARFDPRLNPKMISGRCLICNHPLKAEIEAAIAAHELDKVVAERYGLSSNAVARHRRNHFARLVDDPQLAYAIHKRRKTGPKCGACHHHAHDLIDAKLGEGHPPRRVARMFGLTVHVVRHHWEDHVRPALLESQAQARQELERARLSQERSALALTRRLQELERSGPTSDALEGARIAAKSAIEMAEWYHRLTSDVVTRATAELRAAKEVERKADNLVQQANRGYAEVLRWQAKVRQEVSA